MSMVIHYYHEGPILDPFLHLAAPNSNFYETSLFCFLNWLFFFFFFCCHLQHGPWRVEKHERKLVLNDGAGEGRRG